MIKYENECVGCSSELGCMENACPNRNVPHLYCDKCGDDVERLYEYNGEELCVECLLDKFNVIELS